MEIGFDYTRSLGPTLSQFMAAISAVALGRYRAQWLLHLAALVALTVVLAVRS